MKTFKRKTKFTFLSLFILMGVLAIYFNGALKLENNKAKIESLLDDSRTSKYFLYGSYLNNCEAGSNFSQKYPQACPKIEQHLTDLGMFDEITNTYNEFAAEDDFDDFSRMLSSCQEFYVVHSGLNKRGKHSAKVMSLASNKLTACKNGKKYYHCHTSDNAAGFSAGDGSANDPFVVCDKRHIDKIRNDFSLLKDKHFVQNANIDLQGGNFESIGSAPAKTYASFTVGNPTSYQDFFEGSYDGGNYSIENMTYKRTRSNGNSLNDEKVYAYGFFRSIGSTGSVKNLKFVSPKIHIQGSNNSNGDNVVGLGIAACYNGGLLDNITVQDAQIEMNDIFIKNIGGITAITTHSGSIQNSLFTGGEFKISSPKGRTTPTIANNTLLGGISSVLGKDSTIKNTHVKDTEFFKQANQYDPATSYTPTLVDTQVYRVGGALGTVANGGKIEEVSVSADSTIHGHSTVGGLIGIMWGGKIVKSFSLAKVISLNEEAGGLVGFVDQTSNTIEKSYSKGNVSCEGDKCGGLIGYLARVSQVDHCFATGQVTTGLSSHIRGGLVGEARGVINYSYSVGKISPNSGSNLGGFCGDCSSLSNSTETYWDTDTSGTTVESSNASGHATLIMTDPTHGSYPFAGWDTDIWDLVSSDYPQLK
jgi:hypothetical protein